MKMLLYTALMLIFVSFESHAQEMQITVPCEVLKSSQSAHYMPSDDGIQAADIDQEKVLTPVRYPLEVPVALDLIRFLNLELPDGVRDAINLESNVAYMKVYEDGRVDYNGTDISDVVSHRCSNDDVQNAVMEPPVELVAQVNNTAEAATQKISPSQLIEPARAHEKKPLVSNKSTKDFLNAREEGLEPVVNTADRVEAQLVEVPKAEYSGEALEGSAY